MEQLVKDGYSLAFGARFLKRAIDERLKLPISARWKEGSHFEVSLVDDVIRVEPTPARILNLEGAIAFGDVA